MVRVRFAPSPTGSLHIGNIRTALFNYLFAKRQGGQLILRIEDTDVERSRPEFHTALIEDLLWMGIRWDEGPDVGGKYGPYLQSGRLPTYRDHVDKLLREGKAYHCYVTEEEAEEMRRIALLERRPPRFDNRGRNFSAQEIEERKARGVKPTVRFKIENPRLRFRDLIRGEVTFNLDDMVGDFVIQRADGMPTFHLAVCVDDGMMDITHVIRGEDHLSNAPKHILLLEAMGYKPPEYGHLSLVHGPGGEPLSKRIDSVSVREFRRRGYLPQALANYIALLGWAPGDNREILRWEELQKLFSLDQVNKSASAYDPQKLDWVNGEHLRMLSDEEFTERAFAYLRENGKLRHDEAMVRKILPIFKDNVSRLEELEARLEILSEDFSYEHPDLIASEESRDIFRAALEVFSAGISGGDLYDAFINAIKQKVRAKGKGLFMPIRMALTGKEHGPELKRIFPVLGVEGLKRRLERALEQKVSR